MKHRSVNRYAVLPAPKPAGRSEESSCRQRNPESASGAALAFQEDFNLEHSRAAVTIGVFALSDPLQPARPKTADPREPASPSCIYFG